MAWAIRAIRKNDAGGALVIANEGKLHVRPALVTQVEASVGDIEALDPANLPAVIRNWIDARAAEVDADRTLRGRVLAASKDIEHVIAGEVSNRLAIIHDHLRDNPAVDPETVKGVLSPRVATTVQSIRAWTQGF